MKSLCLLIFFETVYGKFTLCIPEYVREWMKVCGNEHIPAQFLNHENLDDEISLLPFLWYATYIIYITKWFSEVEALTVMIWTNEY